MRVLLASILILFCFPLSGQGKFSGGSASGYAYASYTFSITPIELFSLEGNLQENSIQLVWITLSESNNSHFNIERMDGDESFRWIGEIQGAGTTQEKQLYEFTDPHPLSGKNYYRIQQVDFDNHFSYSPIVLVKFTYAEENHDFIFPNPASVSFRMKEFKEEITRVSIVDRNGQTIRVVNYSELEIDIHDLPNGMYFILLTNKTGLRSEKLIVIH
jgi:hypothetical protein